MDEQKTTPQGASNPNPSPGRVARSGLAMGLYASAVIGALGIAAAFIATSQAGAAGWLGRGGDARHERMAAHAEFAVDWVLDRIDATDAQSGAIKQIVGSSLEDFQTLHEARADRHEQLQALLTAETVDRQALEAFRVEQLAALDEATRHLADSVTAIAAELAPEQRKQLAELMAEHRGHHRGHRGHGWGRRGTRHDD